jgi:hypothetical protein
MIPILAPINRNPGYDPAAYTWATAVIGDGGTVSNGRKFLVSNLIKGLKTDGVWTKLDRLWLFAAENSQSALRDLVAASAATATSSPTFTTDRGYTGNGSSSYINSNFTPSTAGGLYAQDSACCGAWCSILSGTGNNLFGASNGTFLGIYDTSTDWIGQINSSGNTSGFTRSTGLITLTRTGPGSTDGGIFLNGTNKGGISNRNGTILSNSIAFLAYNSTGTPIQFSSAQIAAGVIGGGLSDANVANFYARLRTYMTAVGVA